MSTGKKVIVLGGGVAGMSAAHELIERGFEVEVYEQNSIAGGKARSMPFEDSAKGDEKPLPGEHGFRFFPGFYKHVIDTMRRIPYNDNGRTNVAQNLVPVHKAGFARFDKAPFIFDCQASWNLNDLKKLFKEFFHSDIGITPEEAEFFAGKVWQLMTSCRERRLAEYEKIGWWQFIEAESKSPAYQMYFARGLVRCLVAAQPEKANTYTVGDIFLQLIFDILDPTVDADRLLNGPTNDVWINPWLTYLREEGVEYHFDAKVVSINCAGERISSISIEKDGQPEEVHGDYYIAALPVEIMADLITKDMTDLDHTLKNIQTLKSSTNWMNGIQIYLKRDVNLGRGQMILVDSPWALICVSQRQFWSGESSNLSDFGDGAVEGIISVDISNWEAKGLLDKTAMESTRDQICAEVWKELLAAFGNQDIDDPLEDSDFHSFHLDPDIVFNGGTTNPTNKINKEPLLVNEVNTWGLRPEAYTRIPNLFLASDYVRTNTDLATMEGANEAARRAVNSIIDCSGSKEKSCKIWPLYEPSLFGFWREKDRKRFAKGLPWKQEFSRRELLDPHFWWHVLKFGYIRLRMWVRKKWLRRQMSRI